VEAGPRKPAPAELLRRTPATPRLGPRWTPFSIERIVVPGLWVIRPSRPLRQLSWSRGGVWRFSSAADAADPGRPPVAGLIVIGLRRRCGRARWRNCKASRSSRRRPLTKSRVHLGNWPRRPSYVRLLVEAPVACWGFLVGRALLIGLMPAMGSLHVLISIVDRPAGPRWPTALIHHESRFGFGFYVPCSSSSCTCRGPPSLLGDVFPGPARGGRDALI